MTITKEGALASFYTVNKAPIKHLKVYFSPKQAGSGDPSPENIRSIEGWKDLDLYTSGKNIFDKSTGIVLENSNLRVARSRNQGVPFYFKQGLNYTISVNGSTKRVSEIGVQTPYVGKYIKYSYSGYINYTPTEDVEAALNAFWVDGRPEDATDYQIEFGNEVTPFETYHGNTYNIYFPSRTKNLLDKAHVLNAYLYTLENGYHKIFSYDMTRTVWMPCKPNTTYTCHKFSGGGRFVIGTSTREPVIGMDDLIKLPVREGDTNDLRVVTTGNDAKYLVMYVWKENEDTNITEQQMLDSIMVEEGDVTPSTYEPFDGMIYSGYLDLVTGELSSNFESIIFDGTENWVRTATSTHTADRYTLWLTETGEHNYAKPTNSEIYCSHYKYNGTSAGDYGTYRYNNNSTGGNTYIQINDPSFEQFATLEDFTSYLSTQYSNGTPVHFVIPLKVPITYQLTPQEINTFVGHNNIWSNADRVEVEYDLAETNEELYKRRNILLQGAPHVATSSGSIDNFNTDLAAPLKECKISFSPVQEGSGDPSPENVRNINGFNKIDLQHTSKNLLDPSLGKRYNATVPEKVWGADSFADRNTPNGSLVLQPGIYTLSIGITSGNTPVEWRVKNATSYIDHAYSGHLTRTFTITKAEPILIYIATKSDDNSFLDTSVMLEQNSPSDIIYEQYNGQTVPITFPVTSKNLLNPEWISFTTETTEVNGITFTNNYDGSITANGTATDSAMVSFKLQGKFEGNYYLCDNNLNVGSPAMGDIFIYNSTTDSRVKQWDGETDSSGLYTSVHSAEVQLNKNDNINLRIRIYPNQTVTNMIFKPMIVAASESDYSFEPYGTSCYGGKIDLLTGELSAEYQYVYLGETMEPIINNRGANGGYVNSTVTSNDGSKHLYFELGWTNARPQYNKYLCDYSKRSFAIMSNKTRNTSVNVNEDSTKVIEINQFAIYSGTSIDYEDNPLLYCRLTFPSTYNTLELKRAYLKDHPIQFVYPLKHPRIYQLTPQQLTALKGVNNIWSNANGPISVQYWTH